MRKPRYSAKSLLLALILEAVFAVMMVYGSNVLQVTGVAPSSATTSPGSKLTIRGNGFSPDSMIYFDGIKARSTTFVDPSTLEVMTPYLRPGRYKFQLRSGGETLRSELMFTADPSPIDSEIDNAIVLSENRDPSRAIAILTEISKTNVDYQVRAFAHYQTGQIYFAEGDWWRWGGEAGGIFLDSAKSGAAVDTCWRYRLSLDQSDYFLPASSDPDHDLIMADWTVKKDVTDNPEPRFYRGLVNARYGILDKARVDSDLILKINPSDPSYRALAAYIAALSNNKAPVQSLVSESIKDARALSLLGEATFISGDLPVAQQLWIKAAREYPLGSGLAYLAGKKHMARGQNRVAEALLTECIVMAPESQEAKKAKELLASVRVGPSAP